MEIKRTNGQQVVDYAARDFDSLLGAMRDLIPAKLPEWTDYDSAADFGKVLLELHAHTLDIVGYYQDRIANEAFLGTARERRSIIEHLNLIGYRLATAAPAATNLTIIFPAGFASTAALRPGDAFATKSRKDAPSVRFEYTGDARTIESSQLPPDRTYTIPVEEGRLIEEDILGVSDGSPNQRFQLGHAGLILRSIGESGEVNRDIDVWTTLGSIIDDSWSLQESVAFSREEAHDYVVEIDQDDRATLVFGDGAFGAIVPNGATIRARYRIGGGALGNVAAGAIDTIVDAPALTLVGATVTNPSKATGGAERESIDHAVLHAPSVFRSLKRAVTAADFEALALNFKGVGKVHAERGNWNYVTLYVAPEGGGLVSDVLKANLLAYFEDRRPLSTLIEVADVEYVKIYVTATVGLAAYYAQSEMRETIQQAVSELLAFEKVQFAQSVYLSKFYEAIEAIPGVDYVTITEFRRQGGTGADLEPSGKFDLGENELPQLPDDPDDPADQPYLGALQLTLEGGY